MPTMHLRFRGHKRSIPQHRQSWWTPPIRSESPSPAYSQSMSSEPPIPVWPNGWYACDILHGFQAIDQSGTGLSLHTRFVQAFNTPIVKTTYYDARRRWDRRATPAQCHCPRCETDTSRFMVCFHSKPSPSTATLLSRPYYIKLRRQLSASK
jgi:hypothetical protein